MVVAMANNGMPYSVPLPQLPPVHIEQSYIEHGQVYHGFHRGKYMFPCGEVRPGSSISIIIANEEPLTQETVQNEADRMDIYHKLFLVARNDKLHTVPLSISPDTKLRILDLGTGTGIWAIDMAFKYHNFNPDILGVDLSLIQPASIPPGLTFAQRDIELNWDMGQNSWDMIHMRMLNGSFNSWQEIYEKVFRHLKPGTGYMEHVEIDMRPRCDDGTLAPDGALCQWYEYLMDAMDRSGRTMRYNPNTRAMLERTGFTDIAEQVIHVPFNPWPKDAQQKDIGRWFCLGLVQGLKALSMAPFTRTNQWSKDVVDRYVEDVEKEICSRKVHSYCTMHIWTARRPFDQ